MGLASEFDVWHMYVQKRKHLGALKANILPIALELVLSIGPLSEYLKKIDGLALKNNSTLQALCIAVIFHHFPRGTDVQQGALIFPLANFYFLFLGIALGISICAMDRRGIHCSLYWGTISILNR